MLRFMGTVPSEAVESQRLQKGEASLGPLFEVGVFTVDLVPDGRLHLLRASVSLQTISPHVAKVLETRKTEVKDLVVTVLRGHTPASVIGRQGMDTLRHEICDSINSQVTHGGVTDVYFPEFVMQ